MRKIERNVNAKILYSDFSKFFQLSYALLTFFHHVQIKFGVLLTIVIIFFSLFDSSNLKLICIFCQRVKQKLRLFGVGNEFDRFISLHQIDFTNGKLSEAWGKLFVVFTMSGFVNVRKSAEQDCQRVHSLDFFNHQSKK